MVRLLYSHTRIGTEHGFRQFWYGSPWVTEKPMWPHSVWYQAGPTTFQRSSLPDRLTCALESALSVAKAPRTSSLVVRAMGSRTLRESDGELYLGHVLAQNTSLGAALPLRGPSSPDAAQCVLC